MTMKPTRRDVLALGGGVAAGIFFTPVPWKLLDDASIWTQNWPWIPQPVSGPVEWKESACSLCAAGCGLRVKMAGGYAVGLSGNGGALCALGYGAHQMNWHPRRLTVVRHNGQPSTWEEAGAAFQKACAEGPVAIVDGRPGRGASQVYRQFAGKTPGALYAVVRMPEEEALRPVAALAGVPVERLGYDLENTKLVLSLGAPLLEGWGGPQRVQRLWPALRIIQAETELSRTGSCASRRVQIQSGGEAALAMAVAQVLLDEKLATGPRPPMSLAEAAGLAGVAVDDVRSLARTLAAERPSVVISSRPEPAVAALNVLLGAVGDKGGIIARSGVPEPARGMDELPGALRAALLDSTVPWDQAPAGATEVFRFTAWRGGDEKGWLLPAPGFLEEAADIPAAPGAALAACKRVDALLKAPAGVKSAVAFLGGALPEFKAVESAVLPLTCKMTAWPSAGDGRGKPSGASAGWTPAVLAPLATKLYQESKLKPAGDERRRA